MEKQFRGAIIIDDLPVYKTHAKKELVSKEKAEVVRLYFKALCERLEGKDIKPINIIGRVE